jgi:hypothetical protein
MIDFNGPTHLVTTRLQKEFTARAEGRPHPGYTATVDDIGNLLLAPNGSESLVTVARSAARA